MYRLTLIAALVGCAAPPRPPVESHVPQTAPPKPPPVAPIAAQTAAWIEKLSGQPGEADRAVDELEQLGDPAAIPALGKLFALRNQVRVLKAIVALAHRPGGWPLAQPILERALAGADDDAPPAIDAAIFAADALGDSGQPVLGPLAAAALRPLGRQIAPQIAAIRAIGKLTTDKPRAVAVLGKLIGRPLPNGNARANYLAVTGAAINALAALHDPAAIPILLPLPLRVPELMMQIRRAVVASGRTSIPALRTMLLTGKTVRWCSDSDPKDCQVTAPAQFYAALLLGDLRATEAAADLMAELDKPELPAYVIDGNPGPTQHGAAAEALRRLGLPATAPGLQAVWSSTTGSLNTRMAAVGAYAYAARDTSAVPALGKIAFDNNADDGLRTEAILAYGRLGREAAQIPPVFVQAQKYVDASTKNQKIADRERPKLAAADKKKLAAQQASDAATADLRTKLGDPNTSVADIKAATTAAKATEDANKLARRQYKDDTAAFHTAERMARDYLKYARMFQLHAARIDLAITCKSDPACYAATLKWTPADATNKFSGRLPGVIGWPSDDRRDLLEAYIDRATIELGKLGDKAQSTVPALLALVVTDQRGIRRSILDALPKIVATPCAPCVTALDAAIAAGEGKPELADLSVETQIVRNYFAP